MALVSVRLNEKERKKRMSSSSKFVEFVLDSLSDLDSILAKKMFGEYAIYCNGKVVGLICDDRLFVKPTPGGKEFIKSPEYCPPYQGAKDCFLIEGNIDDREWLTKLIRITERELPEPKPKKSTRS